MPAILRPFLYLDTVMSAKSYRRKVYPPGGVKGGQVPLPSLQNVLKNID